jgi:hypothetical protein
MELTKTRHDPADQVAEHLWIQKECRIRFVSLPPRATGATCTSLTKAS